MARKLGNPRRFIEKHSQWESYEMIDKAIGSIDRCQKCDSDVFLLQPRTCLVSSIITRRRETKSREGLRRSDRVSLNERALVLDATR